MFRASPTAALGIGSLLLAMHLMGCQQPERDASQTSDNADPYAPDADLDPLIPMETGPVYHIIEGYDPKWSALIREGVERASDYWGSYGPTHVWIVGTDDGEPLDEATARAWLDEYCTWRTEDTDIPFDDCLEHAHGMFIEVVERGEPEAYLSEAREKQLRMAELVFINVQEWYVPDEAIPDPILRGIHEYTHVFQLSVGPMPTWMMEGGAVFAESWLPALDGRRDVAVNMRWIMERAKFLGDPDLSIADMESIETAPPHVAEHYMDLAYDSGAWATAFMVHRSPTRSVADLRDRFYPMVAELGWETALSRYVGMQDTQEFYEAFEVFMDLPIEQQLAMLDELEP